MEESDLLKERLQAITERHHIQEDIREKKMELDREKLKLQHLKKKSLREQWLLQDLTTHNAIDSTRQQSLLSDKQQARALQLNIHRIEREVESLEREESMISTNESFILDRLKAVEKSSEDIIKEAQDSFVPEPLRVTTVIPDVPECPSPPATKQCEQNPPRKTLFAMEINVAKNLLTGKSTVLSTATVSPEELDQHAGLKVFDDGRKCVYALNSQEGSHEQSCVSELSANEVEKLLRSATVHRQVNQPNYRQNHGMREELCFYNQRKRDKVEGGDHRHQTGQYGDHVLRNKDFNCKNSLRNTGAEPRYGHEESYYWRRREEEIEKREERNNQSNLRDRPRNFKGLGHLYGNQEDDQYSSYQVRHCVQEDQPASCYNNAITRSNNMVNGGGANGLPRSLKPEVVSPYQAQLCYTPASYIPLRDYISVDEEELYCFSPPSCHSHDGNPVTAFYSGSTPSDRVPSPLYRDDTPYTILNTVDTTEPITATFMGFQMAHDDSGQPQDFEGSLTAELVIIEDHEDNGHEISTKAKMGNSCPTGSSANVDKRHVKGVENRCPEKCVGPGIQKKRKHKHCCTVC